MCHRFAGKQGSHEAAPLPAFGPLGSVLDKATPKCFKLRSRRFNQRDAAQRQVAAVPASDAVTIWVRSQRPVA
jgi:hypothetical protein